MNRPKTIDREQVLDAAENIVVSRGAAELTIDAVAKAAGITKGGVQSCFGTKANLIAAMLQRWSEAYERMGEKVAGDCGASPIRRHIRVTATSDALNMKSASLLAALLQSREQLAPMRKWYALRLDGIDASTDEGRRTRLAFLACEGAFMLRYFGLADISDAQWRDVFLDIERCTAPEPQTQEGQP